MDVKKLGEKTDYKSLFMNLIAAIFLVVIYGGLGIKAGNIWLFLIFIFNLLYFIDFLEK